MTLQLRVTEHAQRDVETILNWLAARSPRGAARWFDKYLDMLRTLPERAAGCSAAPESATLGRNLQQLLFKTRKGNVYRSSS